MATGRALVCATVAGRDMAELRVQRDAARGADLVEVRLDMVAAPDVAGALAGRARPVVVTCRHRGEGGRFEGPEDARRALLLEAFDRGAEYVDLEWACGVDDIVRARRGRNVVLSFHDFDGCPDDIESRVEAMAALDPEVLKVAVAVRRLTDCARLAAVAKRHTGRRLVMIGMGEAGAVTRILPGRFGSCWTYAGDGMAPGQIGLERLLTEFRVGRFGARTALYGVAGRPIAHSLSPAMHNAAFDQLGVDAAYAPLAAADVDDLVDGAAALDVAGLSVTAPYKVDVMARLASIDDEARRAGAVNTMVRAAGGWHGCNTDMEGFLAGCGGLDLGGRRVAVLGTGGAARAVALAASRAGASVTCYGRDRARADALAAAIGVRALPGPVPEASWDVLVNATPVGTHPAGDETPYPAARYDGEAVYDLVYNPPRTRFLRDAAAGGCRTIGGLDMLVEQARLQIALWTGRTPDAEPMRQAAERALARQAEQA